MRYIIKIFLLVSFFLLLQGRAALAGEDLLARGRYLVVIAGCNDCHTPGYAKNKGSIPESKWLTGNPVGFKGSWGITFPENLRLLMQRLTEEQWVAMAESFRPEPPMPWYAVSAMSLEDKRAIYRFIRSLGPAGVPAPEHIHPDEEVGNHKFIVYEPESEEHSKYDPVLDGRHMVERVAEKQR